MSNKRFFYVVIAMALLALGAITLRTTVTTSAFLSTPRDGYDEVERNRAQFRTGEAYDTSYDEVERTRAKFSAESGDRSYDEVERTRAEFHVAGPTDLSDYWLRHRDEIRRMAQPDLSDYALRHPGATVRLESMPDMSDYALRHRDEIRRMVQRDLSDNGMTQPASGGSTFTAPFGPGIAATYGTSSERTESALPFGPQIAADYGRPNDPYATLYTLPFGPGWAATYGVPSHQQQSTNKNPTRSARNEDVANGSVRPPELYDPVRAPDLAGYWNAFSQRGAK